MTVIDSKESAQLLLDSGLLLEINRRVLHPLGLALSVHVNKDTNETTGVMNLQHTEDPSGFVFDDELYLEGNKKINEYMKTTGIDRLMHRMLTIGFISQEPRHIGRPFRGIVASYREFTDTQVAVGEMPMNAEESSKVASAFAQLACACGQIFVRSTLECADWTCPACHVDDGVERMADDDGPERLLSKEGPLE